MKERTSNKTIAKNTLALYVRMGFSMIVALYTSRIILQVLGVTDMGIQASVGGVVGFAGFLNSALSNGSSRFLTYALGKGDIEEMKRTFSTVFWVHTLLAFLIVLFVETIGLWFLHNKLIIPEERFDAAIWVFHLSTLSMAISMTQVPYTACIMSHEKMNIYAYTGIIESVLRLAIVYMLLFFPCDKLIFYSFLYLAVSIGMRAYYRWYCSAKFKECTIRITFDKQIFNPIAKFSAWQLIANFSIALSSQGVLILLNTFFTPAIVAARTISLQVNGVLAQFISNFRNASTPQIVKSYAAGEFERSKMLTLEVTKYSYYLMLLLGMPVIFLAHDLLYIWLGQVPLYTDIFLQLVVVQSMFQVFDTGYYQAIYTKGRLRENALSSPIVSICFFISEYILFTLGFSPIALSIMDIIRFIILGLIIKPFILITIVKGYCVSDFRNNIWPCMKVSILSIILPCLYKTFIVSEEMPLFLRFISVGIVCFFSVIITTWMVGLNHDIKLKIVSLLYHRLLANHNAKRNNI